MMLFLARSALCIGLVAAAGAGVGVGGLATAVDRGTRASVGNAGRSCLASPGCLRAGAAALEAAGLGTAATREDVPPRKSAGREAGPAGAAEAGTGRHWRAAARRAIWTGAQDPAHHADRR